MRIKDLVVGLLPALIVAGVLSMMNPQVATNIASVGVSYFLGGFIVLCGLVRMGVGNE